MRAECATEVSMRRRASRSDFTRPPPQAGVSWEGKPSTGARRRWRVRYWGAAGSAARGRTWSSAWKLHAPVHATRVFDHVPLVGAVRAATGGGDADRKWRLNRHRLRRYLGSRRTVG